MYQNSARSRLTLTMTFLATSLLVACGPDFEEGAYVDSRFGTTYEFGPEGQGRLIGGVPGTPTFTYEVDGDQVITSGGLGLTFERIDSTTLERPDGTLFILQESP